LRGRRSECGALDRLLEGVRAGQSRVLVVRGLIMGLGRVELPTSRLSGVRSNP
jgi:hypothetical protein